MTNYDPNYAEENELVRRQMQREHQHEATQVSEPRPFVGGLGRRALDNENRAAHGGVSFIETCECGAWRYVNENGAHVEYGPWT